MAPPTMAVMMMGRMIPPPQMSEVLSEAGSEPSFAEVDLDEKRQKAEVIDEIDASSRVEYGNVEDDASEDGESMRFD